MADLTPAALERARQTERVAPVFGAHAAEIVAAVEELPDGHVVVAVVDGDFFFRGTNHVHTDEIIVEVERLENGDGWAMVFSAGHDEEAVLRRVEEMIKIAAARANLIEKLRAKRAAEGSATESETDS